MIDFKAEIAAAMKIAGEAPAPPPRFITPKPKPEPPAVIAPSTPKAQPTPPQPPQAPASSAAQVPAPAPAAPTATTAVPAGAPPPTQAINTSTAAGRVAAGQASQQPQGQGQQPQGQQPKEPPPQRDPQKGVMDYAKDVSSWAQRNYLDLAAVPIGAALMLFGGKIGAILGALALGGGAYGLYDRFQSLNNMGGEIPIPEGATPEQAEQIRAEEVTRRREAMEAASASDDTWNRWMSNPENAKFFQNLQLVNTYMPKLLYDQIRQQNPMARLIDDDTLASQIQSRMHGRLGGGTG